MFNPFRNLATDKFGNIIIRNYLGFKYNKYQIDSNVTSEGLLIEYDFHQYVIFFYHYILSMVSTWLLTYFLEVSGYKFIL